MRFLLVMLLLGGLVLVVQLSLVSLAFERLGLDAASAVQLLLVSLAGSLVNLPLFSVSSTFSRHQPPGQRILLSNPDRFRDGRTLVAVNVGGCLIPLFFSFYLLRHNALDLPRLVTGIVMVSVVSHWLSRPVRGVGIGMPILVAPLTAAMAAILLADELRAPFAYICGILGVLIGADISRISDVRALGVPLASIGGAGTFDGIFITGLIAALLA